MSRPCTSAVVPAVSVPVPVLVWTSGTACVHAPPGPPGSRPIALNCAISQSIVFVSPGVPGARPSKASEARVFTSADSRSGMTGPPVCAAAGAASDSVAARARSARISRVPWVRR